MRNTPLSPQEIDATSRKLTELGLDPGKTLSPDGSFGPNMSARFDYLITILETTPQDKVDQVGKFVFWLKGLLEIPECSFEMHSIVQFFRLLPNAHHVTPERRVGAVTLAIANIVGAKGLNEKAYHDKELIHDGQMPKGGCCDKLLDAWILFTLSPHIDLDDTDEVLRILELAGFEDLDDVVKLGRENYESGKSVVS